MSIVVAERIAKSFDPYDIFEDVSCSIARGDRIALVGRNGTGKTTLLRILAGLEPPSRGQVHRAKGLRIGYLPQGATLDSEQTLWQEMMTVFETLQTMEARLHELEAEMVDPARTEAVLAIYGPLRDQFESLGGYVYQDRTRHVLMGLGFRREEHDIPLRHLSGGQKTRALLARLLLESPDLLLLDEPTNHLDLQAIEWLEDYLNGWEGTVLLVAHDRYFLDRVVHKVWELAFGHLEIYSGNYSHYVQQREERHARQWKEYQAQQELIAKEEFYIQRSMAGQRSRQAKGRLKRLERFKQDKMLDRPRQEKTLKLRFQTPLRSGDKVVWSQDLVIGYDPRAPLFRCPDLDLRRGECAALLGPNGSGKTTFLKTILSLIDPLGGSIRLGASLKIGYLSQVRTELDPGKTVLESILEIKDLPLGEARSFLARFLFTEDEVFKRIDDLSGGERARVALARLVLQRANFLLLDEPTNHLDIASQEVLEDVLDRFPGTILLVTHDRYLVDRLATQLWIIHPKERELEVFSGTWAEYLEVQEKEAQEAEDRQTGGDGTRKRWSDEQRQVRRQEQRARREEEARRQRTADIEAAIHRLELEIKALEEEIVAASTAQQVVRVVELGILHRDLERQLQEQLDLWAQLMDTR
ncbi:MAG: ABC-F family ATP-binding cassette domain-containing protein [Anaerolineae bacterium]